MKSSNDQQIWKQKGETQASLQVGLGVGQDRRGGIAGKESVEVREDQGLGVWTVSLLIFLVLVRSPQLWRWMSASGKAVVDEGCEVPESLVILMVQVDHIDGERKLGDARKR